MGLHTGEPIHAGERYTGLGVHRTSRIAAAGHGGQVLLSETTRGLIEGEEPPGVTLRDLGPQALKDFAQPQRLYQVEAEGLRSDFPPLRTPAAQEHADLAFVGREAELAAAAREAIDREVARRTRRHVAIGVVAALVAAGAAAGAVLAFTGGRALAVGSNSVGVINPASNHVVAAIPVGARPAGITYGSGSLWVANLEDSTVAQIDPVTRQAVRTFPAGTSPDGVAAGYGSVWVASNNGGLRQINPEFGNGRTLVRGSNRFVIGIELPSPIAVGAGAVWFANTALYRVDPSSGKVRSTSLAGFNPAGVAVGAGAVWVTDNVLNTVTRVGADGTTQTIPVGHAPSGIAVGAGGVWVADAGDDSVVRIDPQTGATKATIPVGRSPGGIAVGAQGIWVANAEDGTVSRIDPRSNRVVATIKVGNSPTAVTVARGRVWVTVQQSATSGFAVLGKGGVAHVSIQSDASLFNLDPAEANSAEAQQVLYATCAKLLNYPDKPAPAGEQLVPEVAAALPRVTDGGRTYTFTIRRGYRFSPPSNQPVTAATFKSTIERALSRPNRDSTPHAFMQDLAGVAAHGNTLTIHLRRPSGSLPARLATPFFCAVPQGTPASAQGVAGIPSAGPYYVAFYAPGQRLVLERNPNYHGPRPHRLAAIDYTIGANPNTTVADIESGRTDYAATSFAGQAVPQAAIPGLLAKYGPHGSRRGPGSPRFFEHPQSTVTALFFNARRPLFRSASMRLAAEYALDRGALTAEFLRTAGDAEPLDQYLPPYIPGAPPGQLLPLHRDLTIARRLAAGRHGIAVMYAFPGSGSTEAIIAKDLAAIGIQVLTKELPVNQLLSEERAQPAQYDIFLGGYGTAYQDPAAVFDTSVAGSDVLARNRFDDPATDRQLTAAERLTGRARIRAYTRIDTELVRRLAPAATYAVGLTPDFLSARLGCEIYQPVYGIDLAALCLRKK
jgi:YVTN family beta-propeller protein